MNSARISTTRRQIEILHKLNNMTLQMAKYYNIDKGLQGFYIIDGHVKAVEHILYFDLETLRQLGYVSPNYEYGQPDFIKIINKEMNFFEESNYPLYALFHVVHLCLIHGIATKDKLMNIEQAVPEIWFDTKRAFKLMNKRIQLARRIEKSRTATK